MNPPSTFWRFIVVLLSFPSERCRLRPAGCQLFNGRGYLTVKPAPTFLIGSNLTVFCHVDKCQRSSKISLELNGVTVDSWQKVNCTTMVFSLFNVRTPRSFVRCKVKSGELPKVVGGLDLHGGLPPDKPGNILCETSKSSEFIDCSWERGRDTHLLTTYNVSLTRENGTPTLLDQIQDAGEITVRRAAVEENTAYRLHITAYNHFGASQSDPFVLTVKDIMIPETPRITQLDFGKNSMAAVLQRKTSESSENLRTEVRLRAGDGSWEAGEGTEVGEGRIRVEGLRPLTGYEFRVRTCNPPSGPTRTNGTDPNSSRRSSCSKWSPSVRGRSPGKGPSQQMHAWRTLDGRGTDGQRMVTVLWKPPAPEDYSGDVQHYSVSLGDERNQEVICGAGSSRCSVRLPAEVRVLSVSAVTSYGTSPPAAVPLTHSGDLGPPLRELTPAANDGVVFVSWCKHLSTSGGGGEPLRYVLEWTSVAAAALRWRDVAKDQNSTFITGLTAGVRYNVSLYAVTSRGVSAPSSGLVYSREQKPASGPSVSVLVHEARRIRIRWDEPPVDEQKGFVVNYTVYLQTLENSSAELRVTAPASGPRQTWLDCPGGALALQMTASTSAGEGRRGNRICSQPESPAVGLVIVSVFVCTIFTAIIANLMCWSCVRERIKQKCISWGPAWLDENLPKPGNSNAIRLLEQYGCEPSFSSSLGDPPLSPISLISQDERDDVYPTVQVEETTRVGSTEPAAETPLLTMLVDSRLEHVGYKPQIIVATQGEEAEEAEEERWDVQSSGQEDKCAFGGLLGGFLSSVEVDFSDPPPGLTLSSVGGLLWPETTCFADGGFLPGNRWTENNVEADSPNLDLQQSETMTLDSADTQCTVEATLTGGYFPQVASVSGATLCDAQR